MSSMLFTVVFSVLFSIQNTHFDVFGEQNKVNKTYVQAFDSDGNFITSFGEKGLKKVNFFIHME